MKHLHLSLALAGALLCAPLAAAAQPVVSYAVAGVKFADVRDDLKTAIEARGFVVDYQAQFGSMLDPPARTWGAPGRCMSMPRACSSAARSCRGA
jgi:hypothetical protein